jgi:hypothetical protein
MSYAAESSIDFWRSCSTAVKQATTLNELVVEVWRRYVKETLE